VIILGLNAYHGDSSACIVVDGKLLAAVEEERFTRIKHWAGFPVESIKYCLNEADIHIKDVDHIAINRNPKANFLKKALYAFSKRPALKLVSDRLKSTSVITDIREVISQEFEVKSKEITPQIHNIEHHIAHIASTFFISPFDKAATVSLDGFGDFVSAMWGIGKGNKIDVSHRTFFPHSMGLFYLAFTQYLGFPKYGDEYKVMGLAAYGEPEFLDVMRKNVRTNKDGFELDLDFFIHHSEGVSMTWDNGEPHMGKV
jgi:carbamoyltransferase